MNDLDKCSVIYEYLGSEHAKYYLDNGCTVKDVYDGFCRKVLLEMNKPQRRVSRKDYEKEIAR